MNIGKSNIILLIIILIGIYFIVDANSEALEYQKKYLVQQAELDTLTNENGRFKKLAQPLLSNDDIKLLESKFDGLEDELKSSKGQLLIAQKTTLHYQKLYMKGIAEKDSSFKSDSIQQFLFQHIHNEMTSVSGLFRSNGYYEIGVDQKPLQLEISYIKTDKGIRTIVRPSFSDVEVSGLESFYDLSQFYKKEKKGLTFDYAAVYIGYYKDHLAAGVGFHFQNEAFRPSIILGTNHIAIGLGYKF